MLSLAALATVALASAGAIAAPLAPRAEDIDTTILQYALTLEVSAQSEAPQRTGGPDSRESIVRTCLAPVC
jgi:hypothetical protein